MTRTNKKKCMETVSKLDCSPGEALRETVWQALEQGRLTFGVHQCARLLEIDPYNTMFCVLPASSEGFHDDVSIRIKHMLIEAFCTEYDIRLVKVDGAVKLAKLILGREKMVDNADQAVRSSLSKTSSYTSVDCLLIKYPMDDPSQDDELVAEYYKTCQCQFAGDDVDACVISLPD